MWKRRVVSVLAFLKMKKLERGQTSSESLVVGDLGRDPPFEIVLKLLSTFLSSLNALVASGRNNVGSMKPRHRVRSALREIETGEKEER